MERISARMAWDGNHKSSHQRAQSWTHGSSVQQSRGDPVDADPVMLGARNAALALEERNGWSRGKPFIPTGNIFRVHR